MKSLLVAISAWCGADPYPYKTVPVCEREMVACVKAYKNDWATKCFVVPEDLSDWGDESLWVR